MSADCPPHRWLIQGSLGRCRKCGENRFFSMVLPRLGFGVSARHPHRPERAILPISDEQEE